MLSTRTNVDHLLPPSMALGSSYSTVSRTATPDSIASSAGGSGSGAVIFRQRCTNCGSQYGAAEKQRQEHSDVNVQYYCHRHSHHCYDSGGNGAGGIRGSSTQRSPLNRHRSPSIVRPNECKHFHYEWVELGPVEVRMHSKLDEIVTPTASGEQSDVNSLRWRFVVESNDRKWFIRRTFREWVEFDRQLHRCVFDRRHSRLRELAHYMTDSTVSTSSSSGIASSSATPPTTTIAAFVFVQLVNARALHEEMTLYVDRLSQLTGSIIKCYPVLKFLELDSRGNRFIPIEHSQINTPAVAAAVVVSDFTATEPNQLTLRVGDIVSVIEMDSHPGVAAEAGSSHHTFGGPEDCSMFWRGKLTVPRAARSELCLMIAGGGGGVSASASSATVHSAMAAATTGSTEWDAEMADEGGGGYIGESLATSRRFRVGYFPASCVQLFSDKLGVSSDATRGAGQLSLTLPDKRRRSTKASSIRNRVARRAAAAVTPRFNRWQSERRPPLIRSLFNIFVDSDAQMKEPLSAQAGRVFGVDLCVHLAASGRDVPQVVTACVEVIECHGLVTGIYRQCGIQSNIRRLRWEFDNGCEPNLMEERGIFCDIHCVSSLLKQYFRQLPDPLFTHQIYERLVGAYGDVSSPLSSHRSSRRSCRSSVATAVAAVRDAVGRMPSAHYRTARYLLRHLSRLARFSAITDMTASNLAIVWAPNLLRRPPSPPPRGDGNENSVGVKATENTRMLMGLDMHKNLCNFMILHADAIFADSSALSRAEIQRIDRDADIVSQRLEAREGDKGDDYESCGVRDENVVVVAEETDTFKESGQPRVIIGNGVDNDAESYRKSTNCIEVNGGTAALPADFHTVIGRRYPRHCHNDDYCSDGSAENYGGRGSPELGNNRSFRNSWRRPQKKPPSFIGGLFGTVNDGTNGSSFRHLQRISNHKKASLVVEKSLPVVEDGRERTARSLSVDHDVPMAEQQQVVALRASESVLSQLGGVWRRVTRHAASFRQNRGGIDRNNNSTTVVSNQKHSGKYSTTCQEDDVGNRRRPSPVLSQKVLQSRWANTSAVSLRPVIRQDASSRRSRPNSIQFVDECNEYIAERFTSEAENMNADEHDSVHYATIAAVPSPTSDSYLFNNNSNNDNYNNNNNIVTAIPTPLPTCGDAVSSSESLPLDVSRYDNVVPALSFAAARRTFKPNGHSRVGRPISTPIMLSGGDTAAPPLPPPLITSDDGGRDGGEINGNPHKLYYF